MIQGNKFSLEDIVYLRTDVDQKAYMVLEVRQRQGNTFAYSIACGVDEQIAVEIELSAERDIIKKLTS